jgi:hypothetical protein
VGLAAGSATGHNRNIGLVVGSCTSHPGVLGSIPKREEPGKTGALCIKVQGSSRVPVRDGQTHPHRPRIVVSHSTCPPLSSPPTRIIGPAVIKHTHIEIRRSGPHTRILTARRRNPGADAPEFRAERAVRLSSNFQKSILNFQERTLHCPASSLATN